MRWRIAIATWPHSTGNGQDADRKAAGAEAAEIKLECECVAELN
jgi:hypothetical protein